MRAGECQDIAFALDRLNAKQTTGNTCARDQIAKLLSGEVHVLLPGSMSGV